MRCYLKEPNLYLIGYELGWQETTIILMSLIICILGGISAVSKLIDFSTEDKAVIEEKSARQEEIAHTVSEIVEQLDASFHKVMFELDTMTASIHDTQNRVESIVQNNAKSVTAVTKQVEMTSEIKETAC